MIIGKYWIVNEMENYMAKQYISCYAEAILFLIKNN